MHSSIKNNVLTLCDYDAFGFDIDHTLVKYNIPNLFNMTHDLMTKFLVEEKNYPKSIQKAFKHHKDLCTRGLILDIKHGIYVKLSEDGTILKAYFGTTSMTDEAIEKVYGTEKHFPWFEDLIETVDNIFPRFRIFENFFDMVGIVIIAKAIDVKFTESSYTTEETETKMESLMKDIIDVYNHIYNPNYFKEHKSFFKQLKEDPDNLLVKTPQSVIDWIKRLKTLNKTMFIVTSAFHDSAKFVMEYTFGKDWEDYFEYRIAYARKPGFFSKEKPMFKINSNDMQGKKITEIKRGEMVLQGNRNYLMTSLKEATKKEKPKVLFFGDSLRSDVFPSKKFADWDNFLILEEMEAEDWEFNKHYDDNDDDDDMPNSKRKKIQGPSQLEKEYLTSNNWGSLFTDGKSSDLIKKPSMNTLWGYIIRKYADVAVPQLEYISELPFDYKFSTFDHEESRQWGFYPRLPNALDIDIL